LGEKPAGRAWTARQAAPQQRRTDGRRPGSAQPSEKTLTHSDIPVPASSGGLVGGARGGRRRRRQRGGAAQQAVAAPGGLERGVHAPLLLPAVVAAERRVAPASHAESESNEARSSTS